MRKDGKQKWRSVAAAVLAVSMLLPPRLSPAAGGVFAFEDWDEAGNCRAVRLDSSVRPGTAGEAEIPGGIESPGEAEKAGDSGAEAAVIALPATSSIALMDLRAVSSLGDFWDGWNGDFSFLDGASGDGSSKKPYEIRNKNQLMGLSQLAAMGMRIQPGEGSTELIGSYDGSYFKLMSSIDLGGMEWNPIGFYRDSSELSGEVVNKFFGHFDGNGKTISNFKLSRPDCPELGFFGAMEDASVENLTLKPGKTVSGKTRVGILAGSLVSSRISDCTVSGAVQASGTAGGIAGEVSGTGRADSVIENCTAHVTVNINGGNELYAGGISGRASETRIVDCRVETGDNSTARIQGAGAVVGGITGFQNDTDIYNSYVSGTIGGPGSLVVGGITGKYGSGHLKIARFEGVIGQSGTGAAGHRGTFIGHREAGDYFRYGSDVAYLFADSEQKIASDVCGSGIPDDNEYTYAAHIGYSHSGDLHYSLVQGGVSKHITDTYYYEELENGILSVMDEDNGGAPPKELGYEMDHFAPNDAGRPERGYLISIPQIDTISSGSYYYDVAVLEARGNSTYCRTLDKEHRGAVAAGTSVTVTTSPKNTEEAKFQMEGVPTYTKGGSEKDTAYVNGGEYTFTMPTENTEVRAVYQKVAVRVTVVPPVYHLSVVEERTGNRKNPVRTTKVLDQEGKLIASYINGELQQGTLIQPVSIQAVVDTNNDVADRSVKWSIDDPDLITLLPNGDEDDAGYTKKSASIRVNLNASFFTDTVRKLQKEQAEANYQYPIPDTIFGAGHQNGGVAVLTAATRPAASFEGKPCTGNCRLNVTYQVKDKTYVANEGASLDRTELSFTVIRTLTGNRKEPQERITVTEPQTLTAAFHPDFFDRKDIAWSADDPALVTVNGENKSAGVAARKDAKWIQNIIDADAGIHANRPYAALNGSGSRKAMVKVIADDMLGNRQTADCEVTIRFVTEDQTRICVEGISVMPENLDYELTCTKSGPRNNPSITWEGDDSGKVEAVVLPGPAFNKNFRWKAGDDSLIVSPDGTVRVNTGAKWIQEVNRTYPYSGIHMAVITAVTEEDGFQASCGVSIRYRLVDNTYSGSGSRGGSGGGSGGGGSGGKASSGVTPGGGTGPAGSAPSGSVTGTWINTASGLWAFTSGDRTYRNEWAYLYNPYAETDQSSADWFRLDDSGHMATGWFTDTDGMLYYLWPISDGTQGHMVTGWQWIAGADGLLRRYYFNPESDGTRGRLFRDEWTPDGQQVNENGEWAVNGVAQVVRPQ